MVRNFSVIKAYNNADKYALAVGLLADEIAGGSGLVQDWQRPFTKLSFDGCDVSIESRVPENVRKELQAMGHDVRIAPIFATIRALLPAD